MSAHTPGPWVARHMHGKDEFAVFWYDSAFANRERQSRVDNRCGEFKEADARLIAAAPELLKALRECIDLAWLPDSHAVRFDQTVLFSEFYDFAQLEGSSREEFLAQYECVVLPGQKWSAYCTYEGSLWFEKFDTASEAKEACMRLLDKVLPDHPAMKARAAIAKATGEQS